MAAGVAVGEAPVLDPAPTLREFARRRRVAWVMVALLMAMAAPFAWFAWDTAWLYGTDSVRHTTAKVLARWTTSEPERWWVRYAYTDDAGRARTVEHSLDAPPDHAVGDTVAVVTSVSKYTGEPLMDVVSRDDVIVTRIFWGMAGFIAAVALGLLWFELGRFRWRLRLLRDGERLAGRQPTLRHRTLPLGPGIGLWQLSLRYYDPATLAWAEAASDWLQEPAPDPATMPLPPVLRDPRPPHRTWIAAQQLVRGPR